MCAGELELVAIERFGKKAHRWLQQFRRPSFATATANALDFVDSPHLRNGSVLRAGGCLGRYRLCQKSLVSMT